VLGDTYNNELKGHIPGSLLFGGGYAIQYASKTPFINVTVKKIDNARVYTGRISDSELGRESQSGFLHNVISK
jgi:hypothetical protein